MTYRCGHEAFLRSNATTAQRDGLAERDCRDCVKAARNADAIATAQALGLPEMVNGSAKQTGWAIAIREQVRQAIEDLPHDPERDVLADALLYGITDATWWIDHRDDGTLDILRWVEPIVTIARTYQTVAVAA